MGQTHVPCPILPKSWTRHRSHYTEAPLNVFMCLKWRYTNLTFGFRRLAKATGNRLWAHTFDARVSKSLHVRPGVSFARSSTTAECIITTKKTKIIATICADDRLVALHRSHLLISSRKISILTRFGYRYAYLVVIVKPKLYLSPIWMPIVHATRNIWVGHPPPMTGIPTN